MTGGKLNNYLAEIDEQTEELSSRPVKQLAEKEGVTEALKTENQMLWVQKMNNIRNTAGGADRCFTVLSLCSSRRMCRQPPYWVLPSGLQYVWQGTKFGIPWKEKIFQNVR